MRLFLDTDVLLDVLLAREAFLEGSSKVVDWAESHPGQCAVSWHGLANIHYLCEGRAEDFIKDLLNFAVVPKVGNEEMRHALSLKFSDLEDAMQAVVALAFDAHWIATRNTRDIEASPVRVISPDAWVAEMRL